MAIMGILAAIVMPAISRARTRALRHKTMALIKEMTIGIESYALDRSEYPDSNVIENHDPDGTPIQSFDASMGGGEALYYYLGTEFEDYGDRLGPYVEFSRGHTIDAGRKYIAIDGSQRDLRCVSDPWGAPIFYITASHYALGNKEGYKGAAEIDEDTGRVIEYNGTPAYYAPRKYQIFSLGPDVQTTPPGGQKDHHAGNPNEYDDKRGGGPYDPDNEFAWNNDDIVSWQ